MKLIEEIFGEAMACEGTRREALLTSRCGGDPELRREVVVLLDCAGVKSGVLDGSAPELVALPRSAEDPTLLPAGTRVGPYTIKSALGVGGMGVVYIGEQARPKRTVALKVIRPGFATPGILKRFEYEAELLGRLQHPGIAQIIEAGAAETPFGVQPFFAMELVEGEPLNKYADRHNLGVRARVALLVKVCDAVEHAHQRGVIHRDLKPANILVDASGQPKILDFGVARATGGREAEQRLTMMRTGERQLVGTLAYMSPEQVSGDVRGVDTRSDVYSLGVILYELLSGKLPHDLSDKPLPDAVRLIRDEDPRRLSSASRVLRGDLDTITGMALARDPARRYQSAAMLAADLARYLDNAPILARPPSVAYQVRKFAARHRAVTAGAAAALLCLGAGLAVSIALWRDAEAARALAVSEGVKAVEAMKAAQQAQRDAEAEAARQQVIVKFFHDHILTETYWTGPSTATMASLENAIPHMSRAFAKDPMNEARLLYSAAQIFNASGNSTKSNTCLNRAIALFEAQVAAHAAGPGTPPVEELFDCRNFLCTQVIRSMDPHTALPLIERNLAMVDQLKDPEGKRRACVVMAAMADRALGRFDKAEPPLADHINSALADDKSVTMNAFVPTNRFAPMLAEMGRFEEAQAAWDRIVAREEKKAGPNRATTQFLDYAAIMWEQLEEWPRAAEQHRRMAESFDRFMPAGSNDQIVTRSLLVRDLLHAGTPAAIAEALTISADHLAAVKNGTLASPYPDRRVDLYADRLAALIASKDLAGAAAILPEALAAADAASVRPYQVLQTRLEAARLALAQSRAADAVTLATGEHERRVRVKGRTAPETLEALELVSEGLAAAGRSDEARAYCQRQIDARTAEVGLRDYDTVTLVAAVADAALARGDRAEGERCLSIAWRESEALTGWYSKRSLQLRAHLATVRAGAGRVDAARSLIEDGLVKCRKEFGESPHPRTKILLDALAALAE
jgi:tetratricopeptide (TPR) repeat protein